MLENLQIANAPLSPIRFFEHFNFPACSLNTALKVFSDGSITALVGPFRFVFEPFSRQLMAEILSIVKMRIQFDLNASKI
jgi:hypothetical protein